MLFATIFRFSAPPQTGTCINSRFFFPPTTKNSPARRKSAEVGLAGVLARKDSMKLNLLIGENNNPIWTRPICEESNFKEIPTKYVCDIKLLDLVEYDEIKKHPVEHQRENVLINPDSLRVVSKLNLNEKYLKACESNDQFIFGNKINSVYYEDARALTYSLMLIKSDQHEFYKMKDMNGKDQIRGKFVYKKNVYDLPVTDIDFRYKILLNKKPVMSDKKVYFTISLGPEIDKRCYKLIAGIIVL